MFAFHKSSLSYFLLFWQTKRSKQNFLASPPWNQLEVYSVDEAAVTTLDVVVLSARPNPLTFFFLLVSHSFLAIEAFAHITNSSSLVRDTLRSLDGGQKE